MPLILTLLALGLASLAVLWLLQRRLIYFPSTEPAPPASSVLPMADEVSFETDDHVRLGAWFVRPSGPGRATVLVFNGNAGDRSYRAPLAEALAKHGLGVLLFDYRGYGGNPGRPSEHGLASDARAARAFVESRPNVDPERLVYFGESLGAAVALSLAVERPPAALILVSPFTSLRDMGRLHYPYLPTGPLLRDRFDSIARAGQLQCPVLVVAGDRDRVVPLQQSQRLHAAIQHPRSRLLVIPGADHNDFDLHTGPRAIAEVTSFIDSALPS